MTRHARNCTAGAVYTYHEKKKDNKACGYGTLQNRIGKDSVKDFDCCCLTLQPCRNPVLTPHGYLYDKEAILEYIIHQKKRIAKEMKEYKKYKSKEESMKAELAKAEEESKAQKFIEMEKSILSKPVASTSTSNSDSISNVSNGREKNLPSFWVPSLTPQAEKVVVKPPQREVLCPMSGKPLKHSDLIPVIFTEIKDPDDKRSLITKKDRYMCAVTHDALGNSVPCAVLRTSGHVVTMECVKKLIKKDMIDPTNGKTLKEQDIIPMQRGGTGYASTNEKLDAKLKKPVMMA